MPSRAAHYPAGRHADLRKHVVGELCLEGDNRIVQGSMPDMLARVDRRRGNRDRISPRSRSRAVPGRVPRRLREGCEPKDSRFYPTCTVLPCLCLELRLTTIGVELCRKTGAVAIP